MLIPSWSHSRLMDFEKCKYRSFLLNVERVKEPERALPAGKTEHANDRGTRIHNGCEAYVKGEGPLPMEAAKHFGAELKVLRDLYPTGCVSLEGEWGMNQNWEPWNWSGQWMEVENTEGVLIELVAKKLPEKPKSGMVVKVGKKVFMWVPPWLRLKLDALVFESPQAAIAIDYKSGRKFGNEIKHGEQLQLYQLVTFLRYPELERVTTELWYLDVDDLSRQTFTRAQGLRFKKNWDSRGIKMTTCTQFPANPSTFACKWCGFGPWEDGTGHCKVGKR